MSHCAGAGSISGSAATSTSTLRVCWLAIPSGPTEGSTRRKRTTVGRGADELDGNIPIAIRPRKTATPTTSPTAATCAPTPIDCQTRTVLLNNNGKGPGGGGGGGGGIGGGTAAAAAPAPTTAAGASSAASVPDFIATTGPTSSSPPNSSEALTYRRRLVSQTSQTWICRLIARRFRGVSESDGSYPSRMLLSCSQSCLPRCARIREVTASSRESRRRLSRV